MSINHADIPAIVDSLNEKSDMVSNAVNCLDVIKYPELLPLAEHMIKFNNKYNDSGELWADYCTGGGIE